MSGSLSTMTIQHLIDNLTTHFRLCVISTKDSKKLSTAAPRSERKPRVPKVETVKSMLKRQTFYTFDEVAQSSET